MVVLPREVKDLQERVQALEQAKEDMWKVIQKRVFSVDELMTEKAEGQMATVCRFYEDKMNETIKQSGKHIQSLRQYVNKEMNGAKSVCKDSKAALAELQALDQHLTKQWEAKEQRIEMQIQRIEKLEPLMQEVAKQPQFNAHLMDVKSLSKRLEALEKKEQQSHPAIMQDRIRELEEKIAH